MFVFGVGEGGVGVKGGMLDLAAFAGRCVLCQPFAALKAKKMSPLCGIQRTHKRLILNLHISRRCREYGSLVVCV